jgi:TRAP-type transport system periplasmic protein
MSHGRRAAFFLAVTLVFSLTAAGFCLAAEKAPAKQMNFRFGHVVQVTHPAHFVCDRFAKQIGEKSSGRIKITVFPARQLGDDRQLFEQIQQGSLDMAMISAAPMGSTAPVMTALQLPFLFNNWDQYLKVMRSDAANNLLKVLEKNGVKVFAVPNGGLRYLVSVAKPIMKVEDMKGMKVRVAETPLHVDIFRALNTSPTPMPYGEIYSGLQNKVIDGLEMDLPAMMVEKHYEVAKNVTLTKHFTWPMPMLMNLEKFNRLSPQDQEMILNTAKEGMAGNIKDLTDVEAKAFAFLKTKNVKFVELSPEALAPFIQATKGVEQKYTALDPLIAEFAKYGRSVK